VAYDFAGLFGRLFQARASLFRALFVGFGGHVVVGKGSGIGVLGMAAALSAAEGCPVGVDVSPLDFFDSSTIT
jgi:hypothetical protein